MIESREPIVQTGRHPALLRTFLLPRTTFPPLIEEGQGEVNTIGIT